MATKSGFRLLLGLVILILGFISGVAWTSTDKDREATTEEVTTTETDDTEEPSATAPPPSLNADELATIKLFEDAAPSVCFITTSNVRRDFWTRDISEIPRGTGSGFIWDDKGHIVTNYHVLQGADKAQVSFSDRSSWPATLVGIAPEKDLAVLKVDLPKEASLPLPKGNSENLRVGQSVYAIGNPFGLDQTLTTGIVSALGREINSVSGTPIRGAIQTDAAINPGNSGGPLLDSSGKLIGVNTAIYSPSGASAGIGFSIPVNEVKWVVPELIKYGRVKRPSLGIETAHKGIMNRLRLSGALVLNVVQGSAAEKAGIQSTYRNSYGEIVLGDVITGINGEAINSNDDLILVLEKYEEGDLVTIQLLRDKEAIEVELQLDPPK